LAEDNYLLSFADNNKRSIIGNEENLIRQVLEECKWNKTAAALQLGISRSTLYEKLRRYHINTPTLH
jgi:transcriptional regulator of acetoin/glycerol metabolism